MTAIVESGITLRKAVNNFTNTEVTPKINDLNQRYLHLNMVINENSTATV